MKIYQYFNQLQKLSAKKPHTFSNLIFEFLNFRFCDMVLSFPLTNQQPVMMKLQQTFAFLRYTLRAIYSPSDLLKSARPPWFESGRQQDCSEFLRYLLDTLQEQEKSGSRNGSVFREHRVIGNKHSDLKKFSGKFF